MARSRPHATRASRSSGESSCLLFYWLKGFVIDLRNNPGGLLDQAISMSDAFLEKGEIVSVKARKAEDVQRWNAKAGDVTGGLPIVVLVNGGSASASEIFAAAIQDYGRGVIIGEPSFGKGTVQTVVDLDRVARSDKPRLGELRVTMAQFFRINGGTTQLRGVTPDINALSALLVLVTVVAIVAANALLRPRRGA